MSLREISAETGRSKTAVLTALKRQGINLRSFAPGSARKLRPNHQLRIGIPPYGFAWLRGKLVPDTKEMQVVRLMFKLRQQGLSYRSVAAKLNALGKRTRSRTLWEHTVIRRAILNLESNPELLEEVLSWESKN
jgi:hypothetical protein